MKKTTRLIHGGRSAGSEAKIVSVPVMRASTVLFDTPAALAQAHERVKAGDRVPTYGISNMPQQRAFEDMLCELEGGHGAVAVPSGLAAVAVALLAVVKAGDHVLVSDSVYGPTRDVCLQTLSRFGVTTTFFDPLVSGDDLARLMQPSTVAIYVESPGSLTFEVQDVPAIVRAAHARGAFVIADNAWGTGLLYPVMEYGVDIVAQPATKYLAGHSDVIIGAVVANERAWPLVRSAARNLGQTASPDDLFLTMRGMRTMALRLRHQGDSGLAIARWLEKRPEVRRVLHPALESDPGHALFKRDFKGASGLFGVELQPSTPAQLSALMSGCTHFGIGYSWGGFESLIVPANLRHGRTARPWTGGPLIRLHAGLEDPEDLIADLDAAFARWRAAA